MINEPEEVRAKIIYSTQESFLKKLSLRAEDGTSIKKALSLAGFEEGDIVSITRISCRGCGRILHEGNYCLCEGKV